MLRTCAAVIASAVLVSTPAFGVQRTFVASYGLPVNTAFNCSIAKPCRAFSEAIGVTQSGGEVVVLDSAGYGPVTITQSVSIIAPAGIYAGVTVSIGDGIVVNAGASDIVVLRGLSVTGQGGDRGVVYLGGAQLEVDRCVIFGMSSIGIEVGPEAGITTIADTTVVGNREYGIVFRDRVFGGTSSALLTSVRVANNNNFGLTIGAGNQVRVTRSVFFQNSLGGVSAVPTVPVGSPIMLDVTNSTIAANGFRGIEVYVPVSFPNSVQAVIADNVITDHSQVGISIGQDSVGPHMRASLTRNHVRGTSSATGIAVFGIGTEVLLSGNVVSQTAIGLQVGSIAVLHSKGDNVIDDNVQNSSGIVGTANVL